MFKEIKIVRHNGKQFIPDLLKAQIPPPFRGRPEITSVKVDEEALVNLCPTGAIGKNPVSIDLGKCAFCGECAFAFPEKISFTNDHRIASNCRESLVIKEGEVSPVAFDHEAVSRKIRSLFGRSLSLRQVSAGGDNSCEFELNACGNANFDMGRYGIEFVASPRHADGVVITGPISENMAEALQVCFDAIPEPRLVILCGVDAISGGVFEGSPALNREFLEKYKVDLYIPGNPPHPLTIIDGILKIMDRNKR